LALKNQKQPAGAKHLLPNTYHTNLPRDLSDMFIQPNFTLAVSRKQAHHFPPDMISHRPSKTPATGSLPVHRHA
jgi:hypothetical protein